MPFTTPVPYRPSLFRRWLSYVWEQQIQTTSSVFNPYLEVSLSKGRFQLSTENATYSFEDLYDNYFKSFNKYHVEKYQLQKVLILGLGLGSVASMLSSRFQQNKTHFFAVEIDEVVVELCRQYLDPEVSKRLTIFCEDAYDFVGRDDLQYDLIAVDIFLDDLTPMKFRSLDFLQNLKRLMRPNGLLFYNTMTISNSSYLQSHHFFEERFLPVFPNAEVYQMEANRMLVVDSKV
ncbi:MAG: methyltransferase domain-containing protein [Chitinophagales bacterium]